MEIDTLVFSLLINRELLAENFLLMAKSPGAIGEPGHDYLFNDSVFVQAFYNDILGQTDKFLTNGSRIGLLYDSDAFNLELFRSWRFVTPALKEQLLRLQFGESTWCFCRLDGC